MATVSCATQITSFDVAQGLDKAQLRLPPVGPGGTSTEGGTDRRETCTPPPIARRGRWPPVTPNHEPRTYWSSV